eukprot:3436091-Prymnesium_polylepis.1
MAEVAQARGIQAGCDKNRIEGAREADTQVLERRQNVGRVMRRVVEHDVDRCELTRQRRHEVGIRRRTD